MFTKYEVFFFLKASLRYVKLEVLFISYPGNQFTIQSKWKPTVILCLSFEEDALFQEHKALGNTVLTAHEHLPWGGGWAWLLGF